MWGSRVDGQLKHVLLFSHRRRISSLSRATWMGDSLSIIGDRTLKDLTLPGTHDSAAFFLTEIPLKGEISPLWETLYKKANKLTSKPSKVVINWNLAQKQDLFSQLKGGIRYFDIRAGWNETTQTWVAFHFLQGNPIHDLLQSIKQFLQSSPKEIVIVEMSHFNGKPTEKNIAALKDMVFSILGDYLYPVDLSFSFTVNQMIGSGKRVLLTMEKGDDQNWIWPENTIFNTYANTPDARKMKEFNKKTVEKFMNNGWPNELLKISWTLTPNVKTIVKGFLPFEINNLIELANIGNKELPSFWKDMRKLNWRMGNILIIDHYESSDLLKIIWQMNGITA
jgi:hypothetical protein